MVKKCIICGKDAKYVIKDSNNYYCEECAKEYFADISLLQKVEENVKTIKKIIYKTIDAIKDDDVSFNEGLESHKPE